MTQEGQTTIDLLRSDNKDVIQDSRSKHKEHILGLKRKGLQEVSESNHNISLSEFKELLSHLKKNATIEVLRKIKNTCVKFEYIEAVFRTLGATASLTRLLIRKGAPIQFEAASCLINLACGPHKCSQKIAKDAGVYFVSFLLGESHFMQDLSAWAIGNIANDCFQCYKYVKAQGCFAALLVALDSPSSNVLQSVVFALNACTRYDDPDIISLVQSKLPEKLYDIMRLEETSQSTKSDAAFTLCNCCYLSVKYSSDFGNDQISETVLNLLDEVVNNEKFDILIAIPFIRCLGFLSYRDDVCLYLMEQKSFSQIVCKIVKHAVLPLNKELIWVLSNITVTNKNCSPDQYLPLVIDTLGPFLRMQNPATVLVLHFLLCVIQKDTSAISFIRQHGIFPFIKCLLTCEESSVCQAAMQFFDITHL